MRKDVFDFSNELLNLFSFKAVKDMAGKEYILYESSTIDTIDGKIEDKTAFEASENHIHLSKAKEIRQSVFQKSWESI